MKGDYLITPEGNDLNLPEILNQIAELRRSIDDKISRHIHDGGGAVRINLNTDLIGLFETVSAVPTGIPQNPYQQIKFYSNSTTYRLYMYDATNHVWRYSVLV